MAACVSKREYEWVLRHNEYCLIYGSSLMSELDIGDERTGESSDDEEGLHLESSVNSV